MLRSYFRFSSGVSLLFGLALLFVLVGCDSSGSVDDDKSPSFDNSFSLKVTNSEGRVHNLEGFAYFATGEVAETGEEAFVLYFIDDESFTQTGASTGLFGLAVRNSGLPGPGQYAVSQDDDDFERGSTFMMILFENVGDQLGTVYNIDGGSINFDTSTSSRIGGALNLQASSFSFADEDGGEDRVTIKGAFQSPGVNSLFGLGSLFRP